MITTKSDYITKKDLKEDLDEATADIISAVLKGFDGVTKDIARLELRIEKIEKRLERVEQRLEKLEAEVKDIKRTLNDLKADLPSPQDVKSLEVRVAKLEKAVFSS